MPYTIPTPSALPSESPLATLTPAASQAAFVATVAGAAGANPTQAEYAVAVAALNAIKTAMVNAGLMKAS